MPHVGEKLQEFIEAKVVRDEMIEKLENKALVKDEVTLERKGKKRLHPVHIAKYMEEL
jgi:hypothetical protein